MWLHIISPRIQHSAISCLIYRIIFREIQPGAEKEAKYTEIATETHTEMLDISCAGNQENCILKKSQIQFWSQLDQLNAVE